MMLSALVSTSAGQATSQASGGDWSVAIMHPSLDRDGFYHCILTIPADLPINEDLGVYLRLFDRDKQEIGGTWPKVSEPIEGKRMVECRLSAVLIKNSCLIFQVHPNTTSVRMVKIVLGEQKTTRRVNGEFVHEPIE
jgi:hypothetical protein